MFGLVRTNPTLSRPQSSLERWDPWSEMDRVRRDMDELVTRAFGFTPFERLWNGASISAAPPVELYEMNDSFRLRAHLPGMSREDINLEVSDRRITVWGEHRVQPVPEEARTLVNTAGYGRFRLEYELSAGIKADEVRATYRDGILEVELPKVEEDRPKAIKVDIQS